MSENLIGTVSMGIRTPIIRKGDDIVGIITESVVKATEGMGILTLQHRDVVAVTESIVARAQGNYATVNNITTDVIAKYGENAEIAIIFPILSRNRFATCLKGIARATKKIILVLSLPSDEVGNHLVEEEMMDRLDVDLRKDYISEEKYRKSFGYVKHCFTGVDYVEYYKNLIKSENCEAEVIFTNDCRQIFSIESSFTGILCADIHTRERTKRVLTEEFKNFPIYTLDDILNKPINGSGYNDQYGLLGSNKATEEEIKLFPRDCQEIAYKIKSRIFELTGKDVEVMIYGDGAFKDPVGMIWELADPIVSPGYTSGLEGTPNELKLKYLADNDYSNLNGEELQRAIKESIAQKQASLVGTMATQGTTPRRYTDLLGSLADLTSGSGDKGTPVVLIKNYFNNYAK